MQQARAALRVRMETVRDVVVVAVAREERVDRICRRPSTVAKELEWQVLEPWEPLYSDAWARMQAHRREARESEAFAARAGARGRDVYVGGLHLRIDHGYVYVHGGTLSFEQAERVVEALRGGEREAG